MTLQISSFPWTSKNLHGSKGNFKPTEKITASPRESKGHLILFAFSDEDKKDVLYICRLDIWEAICENKTFEEVLWDKLFFPHEPWYFITKLYGTKSSPIFFEYIPHSFLKQRNTN